MAYSAGEVRYPGSSPIPWTAVAVVAGVILILGVVFVLVVIRRRKRRRRLNR